MKPRKAAVPVVVIIEDSEGEGEAQAPLTNLTNKVLDKKDTSESGTTCHQCRHKGESVSKCGGGACRLKFCSKCLFNRYAEKRDEASNVAAWSCPKCRGICNCSICMKKRGCSPTRMARLAKVNGLKPVTEYLKVAKKDSPKTNECSVPMQSEVGKDANKNAEVRKEGKSKRVPRKSVTENGTKIFKPSGKFARKRGVSLDAPESSSKASNTEEEPADTKERKRKSLVKEPGGTRKRKRKDADHNIDHIAQSGQVANGAVSSKPSLAFEREILGFDEEIELPGGLELVSVAGQKLPRIAIGPALQMLEFCSAFQELLRLRTNHGEMVLEEMISGVSRRTSPLTQLHMKLLSIVLEDLNKTSNVTSTTWTTSLRHYLSQISSFPSATDHLKDLENGVQGYDALDVHIKIQWLNTLSDDCLCSRKFRKYVETIPAKVSTKVEDTVAAKKQAKGAAKAALEKKNKALCTLQSNTGLSVIQRQKLIEKARLEAQNFIAANSALSEILVKSSRHGAVRTEPVVAVAGRFCWRLKGVSDRSITVMQGVADPTMTQETWTTYTEEQENMLLKVMASERLKETQERSSNSKLSNNFSVQHEQRT